MYISFSYGRILTDILKFFGSNRLITKVTFVRNRIIDKCVITQNTSRIIDKYVNTKKNIFISIKTFLNHDKCRCTWISFF